MVNLTINGETYEAKAGQRLLVILTELGIRIPHLCFHHALTPAAACKLCVVEVKEKNKPIRTHLACANVCPTDAIYHEDDGRVRSVKIRDEIIGSHTLEKCHICGKLYAPTKFLEHVKESEDRHPEEKAPHQHCPTCSKLYYCSGLKITAPKLAQVYGRKPAE